MTIEQNAAKKGEGRKMYIYFNTLHSTAARSRYSPEELEVVGYRIFSGTASKADLALRRRLRARLCGVSDCVCGDEFGRRPGR